MEEKEGEETMKTEKILELMYTLQYWILYIMWGLLIIVIALSFKNESIGIEYKMIWFLLAILGFTIVKNQTRNNE